MIRDLQSQKEFFSQGNISLTVWLEVWIFFFSGWLDFGVFWVFVYV